VSRYDWMEHARCAQVDPDLWHAEGSGHGYTEAEQICARCPVKRECANHTARLEGAASKRDRHGLWAGQSPRDRLAASEHQTRESKHEAIVRLTSRGGMDAYQVADVVGCDVRTVWRVLRNHREQMGKAA
jgi:WhiB family redox-sensing transcriptional regulator